MTSFELNNGSGDAVGRPEFTIPVDDEASFMRALSVVEAIVVAKGSKINFWVESVLPEQPSDEVARLVAHVELKRPADIIQPQTELNGNQIT